MPGKSGNIGPSAEVTKKRIRPDYSDKESRARMHERFEGAMEGQNQKWSAGKIFTARRPKDMPPLPERYESPEDLRKKRLRLDLIRSGTIRG